MTIQICASWRRLTHTRTRARASIHHTRDRAHTHGTAILARLQQHMGGGTMDMQVLLQGTRICK